MTASLVLGIDVGGTKIAGVAVAGGDVVAQLRRPLGRGDLAEQVLDVARVLGADAGGRPEAIGIAAPGQVEAGSGVIELAVNLGISNLPIGRLVGDALGIPCAVEHDARAIALWLAADEGPRTSLAYVSVGTGISAGIVIDGVVLRGTVGLAGEIGHLLADPRGVRCACGLTGCLETVASGPAVARAAARADGDRPTTTAEVYRAAAEGRPGPAAIVERAAMHLAAAIRGIALSYGVRRVVVGGGVALAADAFSGPLLQAIDRERAESGLVDRALANTDIEILTDDRPLGALGAAAAARRLVSAPVGAEEEVGTR